MRLLNVAYSQEDNPAEYLLNDIKHTFKKELLRNASLRSAGHADGRKSPEVIVAEVLAKVPAQEYQQVILRCVGQMIAKYKIDLPPAKMQAWIGA